MKWRVLINQIFPSHPVISANSRCDAKWHTSFTKLRASPSIDSVLDRDVGHTFWHKNGSVYRHTACIYLFWKKYIYILHYMYMRRNMTIYKYLTKTHVLKDQFRILQVGWFMDPPTGFPEIRSNETPVFFESFWEKEATFVKQTQKARKNKKIAVISWTKLRLSVS